MQERTVVVLRFSMQQLGFGTEVKHCSNGLCITNSSAVDADYPSIQAAS
jgi:hypothetical protein